MNNDYHQPVLVNEILSGLNVHKGGWYIDATIGDGGHTGEILKRGGMVVGIDKDGEAIERASKRLKKEIEDGRLVLMRSNFDKLASLVTLRADPSGGDSGTFFSGDARLRDGNPGAGRLKPRSLKVRPIPGLVSNSSLDVTGSLFPGKKAPSSPSGQPADISLAGFDGILFDLGMSSWQLERSGRGFSFLGDEPLDMRMESELAVTAADLVNGLGKKELVSLFLSLGQVERAGAIAEQIVRRRQEQPIKTTAELAETVEKVSPRRGKLHPATKVFMALRMAVNDELGSLERALPQAVDVLVGGGRLAVISFHEGEDRIVKRFFKNMSLAPVSLLAKFARSPSPARPPTAASGQAPRPLRRLGVASDGSSLTRKFANFANFNGARLIEINKKPIRPTEEEIKNNPRARSAKLRIGEKL